MNRMLIAIVAILASVAGVSGYTEYAAQGHEESGEGAAAGRHFEKIDYPGAKSTIPSSINSRGDVAGRFDDTDGKTHGFLLRDGKFEVIDVPGESFTVVRGMNSKASWRIRSRLPRARIPVQKRELHGHQVSRNER